MKKTLAFLILVFITSIAISQEVELNSSKHFVAKYDSSLHDYIYPNSYIFSKSTFIFKKDSISVSGDELNETYKVLRDLPSTKYNALNYASTMTSDAKDEKFIFTIISEDGTDLNILTISYRDISIFYVID